MTDTLVARIVLHYSLSELNASSGCLHSVIVNYYFVLEFSWLAAR